MPLGTSSTKPLAEFSACFAKAEDRGGRAWAYLPGQHGGTFTDSGAHGAAATYWLQVRAADTVTRYRLVADAASPVTTSIEQCR